MEKDDIDFDSSDDMYELVFKVRIIFHKSFVRFNPLFLQFCVESGYPQVEWQLEGVVI